MGIYTRRKFLKTTAAPLAAWRSPVPSAAGSSRGTVRIRHGWWGNRTRPPHLRVIDIFNGKFPNIEVVGETLGFNDYFTRLATQIAGNNQPDVIQMGYGVMQEYVDRGTMIPLTAFVGKTIDISDVDESAISAGTFNGELYGLTIGANTMATIVNSRLVELGGEEFDPVTWTYDDLKRVAVAISNAAPDGVYGTDDATADWGAFGVYSGQRGYVPCSTPRTARTSLFDVDLVIDYWNLWKDIRDAAASPPGAGSAGLAGQADSPSRASSPASPPSPMPGRTRSSASRPDPGQGRGLCIRTSRAASSASRCSRASSSASAATPSMPRRRPPT